MIYGNIGNLGVTSVYKEKIVKALEYLKDRDFLSMETGTYEIEGKDLFAQVMDITGETIDKKRPEVHKKYIDLQFSPEGEELFGFATDTGSNELDEDLFDSKDIKFYKNMENEKFIKSNPGDFFIFFPWDVHRPGCVEKGSRKIRKVVVKININTI